MTVRRYIGFGAESNRPAKVRPAKIRNDFRILFSPLVPGFNPLFYDFLTEKENNLPQRKKRIQRAQKRKKSAKKSAKKRKNREKEGKRKKKRRFCAINDTKKVQMKHEIYPSKS